MDGDEASRKLTWLARAAAVVLILAAAFARGRGLESSFDRGVDGERCVRAALTRWNDERFEDLERPITAIEIPAGSEGYAGIGEPPWQPLTRPQESELEWDLLLERASYEFFGVSLEVGTTDVEFPTRIPFFLLHLSSLVALWWGVERAYGRQVALLFLAFLATCPPSLAHASSPGTESLALLWIGLGIGVHGLALRKFAWWPALALAALTWLAWMTAKEVSLLLCVLPLEALVRRKTRAFLSLALPTWGVVALVASDAAGTNVTPAPWSGFVDQEAGLGAALGSLLRETVTLVPPTVLAISVLGLAVRVVREVKLSWRERLVALEYPKPEQPRAELGLWIALGTIAAALAAESSGALRSLHLVPLISLGLALFFQQLTRPIAGLKAGIAPLVVAISLLAMPCFARFAQYEYRVRSSPSPRELGAEILALDLPADALCCLPASSHAGRALEFYARRTLVPQELLDRAELGTVALQRGILPWRATLLLPVAETESEDEQKLRALTERGATRLGENETWQAWLLR